MRARLIVAVTAVAFTGACVSIDPEVSTVGGVPTADAPVVVAPPARGLGLGVRLPSGRETGPPPPAEVEGGPGCVNGWLTPPSASEVFRRPLEVIARTLGVKRPLLVVDLRFFQGPESPPSTQVYLLSVRRWYVKGYPKGRPRMAGRWLVEERDFGIGLVALAPYGTRGFHSPDWVGFQYESSGSWARPRDYPGLPGRWSGIPYDFVQGGAGLELPGLPQEVARCLDDT